MSSSPQQFFVRLFGTRAGWPDQMTPDEEKVMQDHFVYLKELTARKKVIVAGPCFDPVFGLVILQTASEAEARELMDREPSVVAGVYTYELQPMRVSLAADYRSPDRYVAEPSDRILRQEVVVKAGLADVWAAWTTSEGVESFFAPEARVELRVGGRYEILFVSTAAEGQRGAEDCRILSWLPLEFLAFEWNAPPDFGPLRDQRTQVIVQFQKIDLGQVRVTLMQHGWGIGPEWDRLYDYFDRAWGYVLGNLVKRFESGPIDWSARQ